MVWSESDLIVPYSRFWAKLPRDGTLNWHPIVGHAADVAAVMERLTARISGGR